MRASKIVQTSTRAAGLLGAPALSWAAAGSAGISVTAAAAAAGRAYSAAATWDDDDFPEQRLAVEVYDGVEAAGDPPADAILTA